MKRDERQQPVAAKKLEKNTLKTKNEQAKNEQSD
jgi:hypothetical protein